MKYRVVLVFDGRCGVCTRSAAVVRRWDKRGRVEVLALQQAGVLESVGITREQALHEVWLREGDRLSGGAEAVSRLLDVLWGLQFFGLVHRIPGIRQFQNWAYRWVADNRYRLPGATPWCELHECD